MELFSGSSRHRPLCGDEIRLLLLLPGGFNDPIQCSLTHESLASAPEYQALSYTWGDATQTSLILLDGAEYPITTNLETSLRYLRDPRGYIRLWVDALCINQLDVQERSAQVPRMRDIYEQATNTIVWLGDYPPHTKESVDSAFALVESVFGRIRGGHASTDTAVQDTINGREADVRVLMDIVQRPWFTRVWVIQEIAMCKTPENYIAAPDEPGFVLGHSRVLFTRFCLSIALMVQLYGSRHPPEHYRSRQPNDVVWIHDMRRLRNELLTGRVALTQAEQLVTYVSRSAFAFDATDERDRIYALLGLLSSKSLPSRLAPNYGLSAERVFLDYAVYMIEETRYLDILTCASGSRAGLPSWVPDWKDGRPCESFHVGQVSHVRFLEGSTKLEVDCMILSRVDKVLYPVEVPAEFAGHVHLEWESDDSAVMLPQSREQISRLASSVARVHAVLMSVETKWFGSRALDANLTTAQLDGWISALQSLRNGLDIDRPLFHGYSGRQLYSKLVNLDIEADFDFFSALSEYCAAIKLTLGASIFQDSNGVYGRLFGYKPKARPAPDDAICYIKGSMYRFLIRPEQGCWRLVGADMGFHPVVDAEREDEGSVQQWEAFWASNKHNTRRIVLQ
ncbi:HET-domain-containing protein [Parathielavia appendiculata]|uniref:HET-domain-containing protein n=1 Tax=Parathielavia appendiculata TaxID=2587402 RepID=A0AAN6U2D3_9PEZI|nr:HET-domain-containing protein [Parathielavia appendiculata]